MLAVYLTPDVNTQRASGFHSIDLRNRHHTNIRPCGVKRCVRQDQSVVFRNFSFILCTMT